MTPAVILNAILMVAVIAIVVTPLVWAILTQHRDHPRPAPTDGVIGRARHRQVPRAATPRAVQQARRGMSLT
jgi:hypothetical protein